MDSTLLKLGRFLTSGLVFLVVWAVSPLSFAQDFSQDEGVLTDGKKEYLTYCATCHGVDAKGSGPLDDLLTLRPPDLTRLRQDNDGQFPFWSVFRVIDGREDVRAHGARTMPVWGSHFLTEEGGHPLNENIVIGRILSVVYYLRSIQE